MAGPARGYGTRPATPLRVEQAPDDWLCSWSCRLVDSADGTRTVVWELKFIHAACREHAHLPAA